MHVGLHHDMSLAFTLSLSLSLNQHGWGLGSLTWLCRRTEPEVEARLSGQWLKSDDSRWEQVLPNTGPPPRRGQTGLVTRCLYPALRSSDLTRQGSRHSSLDCRREREWVPTRSRLASKKQWASVLNGLCVIAAGLECTHLFSFLAVLTN